MTKDRKKQPLKRHTPKTLHWLVIKEYIFLGLVLVSFALLTLEHFNLLSAIQLRWVEAYEIALGFSFIADFVYELQLSSDKRRYIRHNWFFLLAAIPLPSGLADILRSVRFVRIIRLARATAHLEFARHNHIV